MSAPALIEDLRALGDVKVWSVLVTVFGDRAAERQAHIAGPDLSRLLEPLGIKPEALRVALHRLRKDGWIDSDKTGRISLYQMTERARTETMSVRDYVYSPELTPPAQVWLVHAARDLEAPGLFALDRRTGLSAKRLADARHISGALDPASLPGWIEDTILSEAEHARYAALLGLLERYDPKDIETDQAPVRVMILHCWRRLVLRQSPLAMSLLPPDAPAHQCRRAVMAWLEAF